MLTKDIERLVVLKDERRSDVTYFEHYFRYLFARRFIKDLKVLDCACGTGYGSYLLAKDAKEVIGVDVDPAALDIANHNWKNENITYLQLDIARLVSMNINCDRVISFETLEHLDDPEGFIDNVYTVLNKNGVAIISTPNRYAYKRWNANRPNIYHKMEFAPTEFLSMLSKRFSNVNLFGQILFPESKVAHMCDVIADYMRKLLTRSASTYKVYLSYFSGKYRVVPTENIDKYVYMVAVCRK